MKQSTVHGANISVREGRPPLWPQVVCEPRSADQRTDGRRGKDLSDRTGVPSTRLLRCVVTGRGRCVSAEVFAFWDSCPDLTGHAKYFSMSAALTGCKPRSLYVMFE